MFIEDYIQYFKMVKSALLLICSLLFLGQASDWQSYGNFTPGNITDLLKLMDAGIEKATGGEIQQQEICKFVSDSLNAKSDKAWNVFVFGLGENVQADGIIYGYAYREHWFWYNNYGENHYTFIIWKDYNCKDNWVNIRSYATESYLDQAVMTTVDAHTNQISEAMFDDPWKFGHQLVNAIQSAHTGAYSVMVIQSAPSLFSATICTMHDGTNNLYAISQVYSSDSSKQLQFNIMRMR